MLNVFVCEGGESSTAVDPPGRRRNHRHGRGPGAEGERQIPATPAYRHSQSCQDHSATTKHCAESQATGM